MTLAEMLRELLEELRYAGEEGVTEFNLLRVRGFKHEINEVLTSLIVEYIEDPMPDNLDKLYNEVCAITDAKIESKGATRG